MRRIGSFCSGGGVSAEVGRPSPDGVPGPADTAYWASQEAERRQERVRLHWFLTVVGLLAAGVVAVVIHWAGGGW